MPNEWAAVTVLILRFTISQMDVPGKHRPLWQPNGDDRLARQTYVALVVAPEERAAALGITNLVRSIGVAISPVIAAPMLDNPHRCSVVYTHHQREVVTCCAVGSSSFRSFS